MVKVLMEDYLYLKLLGKGILSIQNTRRLNGFPLLESAKQKVALGY